MFRAVPSRSGIGVEFEELKKLLTWEELIQKVKASLKPATAEEATETTLGLENFKAIFEGLFEVLQTTKNLNFPMKMILFLR